MPRDGLSLSLLSDEIDEEIIATQDSHTSIEDTMLARTLWSPKMTTTSALPMLTSKGLKSRWTTRPEFNCMDHI
jgi:hypothetical protein